MFSIKYEFNVAAEKSWSASKLTSDFIGYGALNSANRSASISRSASKNKLKASSYSSATIRF
jgi:hypothetical protein